MSATPHSPLVSVVVPAWNAEATLEETLSSVAAQTYRNIEILIVDDGSTDRTADIAARFCAAHPRARLLRKENGGVASARNRGILESGGEWIGFIDADDLWHPTRIEKMVAAALSSQHNPGFVYCWYRTIDGSGRVIDSGSPWVVQGKAFGQAAYLNVVGNGSGLLATKQALIEAGGYDSSLWAEHAQGAEDVLLQLRIAARHPILVVPEYLVGWRQSVGSMSKDVEQMDRSCRLVFRRLERDGTPVPRRAERRMLASSALDVAEHYAAAGQRGRAVRWLARALARDPIRAGLFVAYRIARASGRILRGTVTVPSMPPFEEADPQVRINGDPYRLDRFARLIENLERSRLKTLAKDDERMALHGGDNGECR